MDQSLRTVATQLLNVTNPDETPKIVDKDAVRNSATSQKQPAKNEASLIKEINSEISNLESMGVGFGRPMNSKFGYFESSHPGQAMAMTEEELEKEMSSTRLITAYKKNHPTTTGGISTWILLNPPSTTVKTSDDENNEEPRVTAKPTTVMERVETLETTEKVEKLMSPDPTTIISEPVPSTTKRPVVTTTKRNANKSESVQSTTTKVPRTTTAASGLENRDTTVPSVTVTKKVQIVRKTSPKVKVTSQKATTTVSPKPSSTATTTKPNQQARPKPSTRRTTTVKPEIFRHENSSTAKIEKVTIRPTEMTSAPKAKTNVTEKPMFVTKIKASVLMDTQKATTIAPTSSTASIVSNTSVRSNLSNVEVPVRSKPVITKVNNVLKVQLKKPTEDTTKIQIEPIKVNAPVLKIQKVEKDEKNVGEVYKDTEVPLDNSRIDLKFDFNPELTKINVVTPTEESPSLTTTTTTPASRTTKRPRNNSKRKKNKVRRRKPSSTSTTSTTMVPVTTTLSTTTENELPTEMTVTDIDIQESKIAPETKIATNASKTKTKTKKPPQKPISTQIYNFLSREVMPSFGVMSLVGLGLGLASYFLYPFGGTISRRNYEVVEPKYKYNLDEYGGNYGQSEEEVIAKVLQGMRNPDEDKYPGTKDSESNYYRYQHYDGGAYDSQTTRRIDQRYTSASPMYSRPENAASGSKYRDTEYRYPEPASTPNYYDRSKQQSEHGNGQRHEVPGSADRQFVVGNVPKGYPPYEEKVSPALPDLGKLTSGNDYEPTNVGDSAQTQNFNFPGNSIKVRNYGRPEVQTQRTVDEERYQEEIEISPTAVAVEHGPRSLKTGRSKRLPDVTILNPSETSTNEEDVVKVEPAVEGRSSRSRRESVIQVIPSKRELEEEEKEEDLSNEIRDIIDSALPVPGEEEGTKHRREENEVEDLEGQKRKQLEEERTRLKESTMRTPTAGTTKSSIDMVTHSVTTDGTSSTESYSSPASSSSESSTDIDDKNDPTLTSTEESTHEWIDLTTKRPAPEENSFNLFNFVKKVAEVKFRLGLTLLKHASEGFARYLGHVQKRINGEE